MNNDLIYDCIIIGCGPAGLLAGFELRKANKNFLILDKGKDFIKRTPNNPLDISEGIGGAGLFSDGKLSYYPSATKLWTLYSNPLIKKAYNSLYELFNSLNIYINKDPFDNKNNTINTSSYEKIYASDYLSIEDSKKLTEKLINFIGNNSIISNSKVINITKNNSYYIITTDKHNTPINTKSIIFATGRYGALNLKKMMPEFPLEFIKYEIGIRIETPIDLFPFKNKQQTDYKVIKKISDGIELRTFCCCKKGKVLKSITNNLTSFNGSKTLDSSFANIGFNLRITDANSNLKKELDNYFLSNNKDICISLKNYINESTVVTTPYIDSIIIDNLKEFMNSEIINSNFSKVYGPTIEGIGTYPKTLNNELSNNTFPEIFIAGDCTGKFRGLMAAFVSGIIAANKVTEFLDNEIITKYGINTSSTENMKIIFTAQSKLNFYCRDVICEYVFKKGFLPLNPFRVFDYFLSDRVDRDIIRQANNQLIQKSDELWVFGNISDGVLFEINLAKHLNIPIKYFSIGNKIEDINELSFENIKFEPEVHSQQVKKEDLLNYLQFDLAFTINDKQDISITKDTSNSHYFKQINFFNK